MKKFLSENWYRLMIGSSLLMASFGFMIQSITSVNAQSLKNSTKIAPSEGIITVKIVDEQLKALSPKKIQSVNIEQILGSPMAAYQAYTIDGERHYSLGVDRNPWAY